MEHCWRVIICYEILLLGIARLNHVPEWYPPFKMSGSHSDRELLIQKITILSRNVFVEGVDKSNEVGKICMSSTVSVEGHNLSVEKVHL